MIKTDNFDTCTGLVDKKIEQTTKVYKFKSVAKRASSWKRNKTLSEVAVQLFHFWNIDARDLNKVLGVGTVIIRISDSSSNFTSKC